MRKILYFTVLICTIFFLGNLDASAIDQKQKTVAKVQRYLNTLSSIQSDFLQMDVEGNKREGKFYLKRPGKVKWEYKTPEHEMVLIDGNIVTHHNYDLNETSYFTNRSVIASLLSKKGLSLKKDINVYRVEELMSTIQIEIGSKDKGDESRLILGFDKSPMELRVINVADPNGNTMNLFLKNSKYNVPIDKKVFVFKNPNRFRNSR